MTDRTNAISADIYLRDLQDFNFDVAARIHTLRTTIHQILDVTAPEPIYYQVADVGGHPALLADALSIPTLTLDLPLQGPTNYIRASGAGLPLRDRSVPIMVAGDTLEHIPPQFRDNFLNEMARCASEAVILAGPWSTPGVAETESAVRTVMPKSSSAWRWLNEHERYGLPNLESTSAAFRQMGFTVSVQPDGDLWEWFQLFLTENTLQGLPGFAAQWASWQSEWNAMPLRDVEPRLTYRHVLVACRKPVTIFPEVELSSTLSAGSLARISAATSLARSIQNSIQTMTCDPHRAEAEYQRLRSRVSGTGDRSEIDESPSFLSRWFA